MNDYKDLRIAVLEDHPLNRVFETAGEKWEEFLDSIRQHGVVSPLIVREVGKGYQVLAGHRRKRGAEVLGKRVLSCVVREMGDKEALEFVLLENLQREEVDTCEEARLVGALVESVGSVAEAAERISRSIEWVETRQGLLALGDEVLAAVRKSKDDEGHLHLSTVQVLLAVPEEERERAVQLVLHPDMQMGVLNCRQAVEVVKEVITEPLRRKREWAANGPKLAKAWKKRLGEGLSKGEKKDLVVLPVEWDLVAAKARLVVSGRDAEEKLPGDSGKTWGQLAVRHLRAVWAVPADNAEGSKAVVEESLLRAAEGARAEAGLDSWLGSGKCEVPSEKCEGKKADPVRKLAETGVEDAGAVMAEIDAAESKEPVEEDTETVIDQKMEWWGMIDLGEVKRLRKWAKGQQLLEEKAAEEEWQPDPDSWPEWVPGWVSPLVYGKDTASVVAACEWVLGLKQGGGK